MSSDTSDPSPAGPVISQTRQRIISIGLIGLAIAALVWGAMYQESDRLGQGDTASAASSSASSAGGGADGASADATATTLATGTDTGPIEGFFPESGEAVACREPIGVDLEIGYGARLTINGKEVPEEAMNVVLDDAGQVTNQITASRSVGHFTFMPTDECPNGTYLRPIDNVLEICVFRYDDPGRACSIQTSYVFDAL